METEATKILKNKNIPFRIIRLSDKGISSDDVVKYAIDELTPDEICKTIITKDKDDKFYALFLKGDDKIDFLKVKNTLGCNVKIITYGDVKLSTGIEPGAICPITLSMPVIIDRKVFQSKKINFGSGNHSFGIEVATDDLLRIFVYVIADFSL